MDERLKSTVFNSIVYSLRNRSKQQYLHLEVFDL